MLVTTSIAAVAQPRASDLMEYNVSTTIVRVKQEIFLFRCSWHEEAGMFPLPILED